MRAIIYNNVYPTNGNHEVHFRYNYHNNKIENLFIKNSWLGKPEAVIIVCIVTLATRDDVTNAIYDTLGDKPKVLWTRGEWLDENRIISSHLVQKVKLKSS